MERRREHRFRPNQAATVRVLALRPGPILQACVLDVSGKGMRLRLHLPLPCGSPIEVEVNDTVTRSNVCRCQPHDGSFEVGVRVAEPDAIA